MISVRVIIVAGIYPLSSEAIIALVDYPLANYIKAYNPLIWLSSVLMTYLVE